MRNTKLVDPLLLILIVVICLAVIGLICVVPNGSLSVNAVYEGF